MSAEPEEVGDGDGEGPYDMGENGFDNSLALVESSDIVNDNRRGGLGSSTRVIPTQIPNSVFLSYDPHNKETVEKVQFLKARLESTGKTVTECTVST